MDMEKRDKGTVASSPMALMGSRADNKEENGSILRAETALRLLPMALCITALVLMLKNSQSNDLGSVSYSNLGAFRYLVHANGICAGYSLLSAIVSAMPRTATMSLAWTFFVLDQLLTYTILAAAAASTEVLYLAHEGDAAVTWSAACGSYARFCNKATASVIITFLALACYTVISLTSSYKLFTRYDSPAEHPANGIEIAAFRT